MYARQHPGLFGRQYNAPPYPGLVPPSNTSVPAPASTFSLCSASAYELARWNEQCTKCSNSIPPQCAVQAPTNSRPGCVERKHRARCSEPCKLSQFERMECGCAAGPVGHQQRVCGPKYNECLLRKHIAKCGTTPAPPKPPTCIVESSDLAFWNQACGTVPGDVARPFNADAAQRRSCTDDRNQTGLRRLITYYKDPTPHPVVENTEFPNAVQLIPSEE